MIDNRYARLNLKITYNFHCSLSFIIRCFKVKSLSGTHISAARHIFLGVVCPEHAFFFTRILLLHTEDM